MWWTGRNYHPDENGLMVEPDNLEEFAKGLSRYLESPVLMSKMAVAGKIMLKLCSAWKKCWIDMKVDIDV
jgi:hypothetical protein